MIKHCSSNTLIQVENQDENELQFQTFQKYSNNSFIRDSLCFTQSIHNQSKHRQSSPIMSNFNKQATIQSQLLMLSSNRKHRFFDTLKQESPVQKKPLSQQVVNPFEIKVVQRKTASDKKTAKQTYLNPCCLQVQQSYKRKLKFLTDNNQQLYEASTQFLKEKGELATQINKLRQQITELKQSNERLQKQNFKMIDNCQSLVEQFKRREILKIRQVKNKIQDQQQEMKIVYKMAHLLQRKKVQQQNLPAKEDQIIFNRSKNQKAPTYHGKRSKTEYFEKEKEDDKSVSQRVTSKANQMNFLPQSKIYDQMDQKFIKLSQQKKRKVETISKQKTVIQTMSTELPSTILDKMGKGKVGKLVEAKSIMGSSKLLYGKNSLSFSKKMAK